MSTRKPRPKRENGEGSAYQLKDGRWRADVTVGYEHREDGSRRRIRQVVYAPTETEAKNKRNELARQVRSGEITVGGEQTVAAWLAHWLDVICVDAGRAPATIATYRNYVDTWIVPAIGNKRLRQVTVEDVERVYSRMRRAGRAPSHVLGCHRALRRAFRLAQRRGRLAVNPCDMMDPPASHDDTASKIEALTPDEARAVLEVCEWWPTGLRWSVALALGLRQSEALGLLEDRVDFTRGMIRVDRQLRRSYDGSGKRLALPKSKAGQRWVKVPPTLVQKLAGQLAVNEAQRITNGDAQTVPLIDIDGEPVTSCLVFTQPNGRPLDHSHDWRDWKELLAAAGVRYIKPHGARHTFATLLLVQGVAPRVAAGVLGHASTELFHATYTTLIPELLEGAANAVESGLFAPPTNAAEPARRATKSRRSGSQPGSHPQGSERTPAVRSQPARPSSGPDSTT